MKFKGKWLPEKESYKKACLRLSKDLTNFKRDPDYVAFVGNDTRGADVVEAFEKVLNGPYYIYENDRIGNPVLHNGKSAGTLRFMKVVEDANNLFIEDIIEIGGGYGGQCLVYQLMTYIDYYTIIDIPEALELSKAYLKANDIECNFISSEDVPDLKCDLLISDYCLSEFDNDGVDFYLNKIDFRLGYFTLNGNFDYIKSALIKKGYHLNIEDERPKTTHHNNIIIRAYKDDN